MSDKRAESLQRCTALISGGGRGIGLATATLFKAEGIHVTILGRDQGRLETAVAQGCADEGMAIDLTDDAAVTGLFPRLVDRSFDIVIANAGGVVTAPYARTDAQLMLAMIETNLLTCTRLVQALVPGMVARGRGRVVAIASTAGLKGYPYVSAYAAAKHALVGYVRAVATELAKTPVTINAVCPGFTDTDLVVQGVDAIVQKTGRARADILLEFTRHNPQGRLIDPVEVAGTVLWLCGSRAGAINGAAIAVAGGEI